MSYFSHHLLLSSASQDIKLGAKSSTVEGAAEQDDEEGVTAGPAAAARANLVSKISKKNLVENVVPIVLGLKSMLEKQHSPLLKNVLTYLCEISIDHKQELAGVFWCLGLRHRSAPISLWRDRNHGERPAVGAGAVL